MLLKLIIARLNSLQDPLTTDSPLLANRRSNRQRLVFTPDGDNVFARVDSVAVGSERYAGEDREFRAVVLATGDAEIIFMHWGQPRTRRGLRIVHRTV